MGEGGDVIRTKDIINPRPIRYFIKNCFTRESYKTL